VKRAWIVFAIACGEPAVTPDAAFVPVDIPPDPFVGRFDDPAELPRTGCTPGSVAGFFRTGYWPRIAMRTETFDGLHTYLDVMAADALVEHALTADDLFVRTTWWNGSFWQLRVIDVCSIDEEGTLRGTELTCSEPSPACDPAAFTAVQLHRIAGEADGEHLVLRGAFRGDWTHGNTIKVRVQRNLAFLARGIDGIRIVSVENPAAPVELAHFHSGFRELDDLELVSGVDGGHYVIAAGSPVSQIVDVTDPTNPQLVAEIDGARSVAVEGQTAYLVDGTSTRVQVYDLSLPRKPKPISTYEPTGAAAWQDAFPANGIVYLSDTRGSGVHVVDFRDPGNPRELAAEPTLASGAWHTPWLTTVNGAPIALDASHGSGSRLRILDGAIGSPTFLQTRGEWTLRDLVSMHDIMAIGSRVYLAHYRDGIRVLDLAEPSAPAPVGYYNTWIEDTGGAGSFESAHGLDLDRPRNRIYVADSIRGLLILEGDSTVFP